MEESDAIVFPILKEVGCNLPPTVTSLKGLIDEHVYLIAAGCLQAINPEMAIDVPTKFPTSKATKFRVATEVARLIKTIGFLGEIGYQSILYPQDAEVRKIISFLISKLPKKEIEQISIEGGATNIQLRLNQTLLQINPANNYSVFQRGQRQPVMIPFNSAVLFPSLNTHASVQVSDQVQKSLSQRPVFSNNQSTQSTFWSTFQPRLQMSTITTEHMYQVELIPTVIQNNTKETLLETRSEERLLPDHCALQSRLQAQLHSNLASSFKQALGEAKIAKGIHEQEKKKKLKNSSNSLHHDNVFSRKAQFAQENTVALASTEPVISAEEQLAQDKAEYELIMKEREDELTTLHDMLDELLKQYKNLTNNIDNLQGNMNNISANQTQLDGDLEGLESTYKTRCHVIEFLPNAQENITKLKQLTEVNMTKIMKLNQEWDNIRLTMIDEYRNLQHQYNDKQAAFQLNLLHLQHLRAEIKSKGNDIRSKEEQYHLAVAEYDQMPKNINRNVYIKRIMDIVKNIDKQNEEIGVILVDIKNVQREITNKGESVKRSFTETDDLIYNTAKAKRSSVAVDIYKDVVGLRDGFNTVINTVETIGKKQNIIRELEQSIDLIQDRGTMNSYEQAMGDLVGVQEENEQLKAQLKAMGVGTQQKKKKAAKQ